MSGARLTAALECANDAEVRFTLWPSSDSHGDCRVSAGAAASYASGDQPLQSARKSLILLGQRLMGYLTMPPELPQTP